MSLSTQSRWQDPHQVELTTSLGILPWHVVRFRVGVESTITMTLEGFRDEGNVTRELLDRLSARRLLARDGGDHRRAHTSPLAAPARRLARTRGRRSTSAAGRTRPARTWPCSMMTWSRTASKAPRVARCSSRRRRRLWPPCRRRRTGSSSRSWTTCSRD